MWFRTSSHFIDVDLMTPAIILIALYNWTSIFWGTMLVEKTRDSAEVLRVDDDAPHDIPHNFKIMLFLVFSLSAVFFLDPL